MLLAASSCEPAARQQQMDVVGGPSATSTSSATHRTASCANHTNGMPSAGAAVNHLSPMMLQEGTFAHAAMHADLQLGRGASSSASPPEMWTDAMSAASQQDGSTSLVLGAAQAAAAAAASKSLQQQQRQHQLLQAQYAQQQQAAAAAADPSAMLYANYRSQHAAAYADADRLSLNSDVSTAAASQHPQDVLAAERAFKARQQLQQQQQLAYDRTRQQQEQQERLLLAHMQQQQQHRQQAAASALYLAATAPNNNLSSNSTISQQHLAPSSSFSHQHQTSHYQTHSNSSGSMHAPSSNTTASRLPPRPSAAAHHYHPYNAAAGAAILEHHAAATSADPARTYQHRHHSLVAAAAAARAAALQQQQQQQQARSSNAAAMRQTASAAAAAAAAALQRSGQAGASSAGRWSGAVAVLDQGHTHAGAQESANIGIEPCNLECDEDLLSMDGCDAVSHHHQHREGRAGADCYGSKGGMSAAAAADAARDAAAQHMAQQQQRHYQQQQLVHSNAGGRGHALLPGAGAAAHQAAAAAAAAAGYGMDAYEEDDQLFDMYEDSGSTHPDSDNQSDDMDADTVPLQDQEQQQQQLRRLSITGSSAPGQAGSSRAAAAAAAAAGAAGPASAARQAVALRVLNSVACRRKGEEVLTAHPGVAEAAGAQSVRPRLLITEVSLYCDSAATSLMAMEQSNRLLAKMTLPDGITYMPVHPDSFLFKAAHSWQFPAFAICLGSSYLQRMLVKLPHLAHAVMCCPSFEDYCRYLPGADLNVAKVSGEEAQTHTATLRSILFTCVFIATKVADQVHALGLLRFILTNLSHNGAVVTLQQAIDVEARCLEALDWRLGPFFEEDELADDDLELWAAAMGHWDYGTTADSVLIGF